MRIYFTLCILCLSAITSVGQNVKAFALSNSNDQYSRRVVYDNSGNMYITGAFKGNNFDADPSGGSFYLNSNGNYDFYIAKYSSSGTFINAIGIGGPGIDEALGLTIDGSGNLYVTGYFRNTVDFDPSATTANVTSNGESGTDYGYNGEVFLAKYNSNLQYQWAFNIGGPFIDDAGLTVKADNSGNVILGGSFRGTNVDFDPSPATINKSSSGVLESFIAKYTSNGQFVWVSTFGGATTVNGAIRDLEFDSNGNIYGLGHFDGQIDLDPGAGTNVVSSAGCGDIYLVKLNSSGDHQWGFKVGGTNCDYPFAIAIDASDNCYITGYYSSSNVDFNPGPATNSLSSFNSNYDIFVAKYDQNGNYVFAQSLGNSGNDEAIDICTTSTGYLLVGYFEGTVDMDASASINSLSSAGGQDGFVSAYLANGQFVNSFRFGGTSNDAAYGVKKRNASEFTVIGFFQGTSIDFDPSATQALLTSAGGIDAFFAIYNQNVLPVNLLDFTVRKEEKKNIINWSTVHEQSMSRFDIQRSINGREFSSIGQATAIGGSAVSKYSFIDEQPFQGINYYRLAMVDKDGKTVFSGIRQVDNRGSLAAIIYPIPAKDKLTVLLSSKQKSETTIQVLGIDGRLYISQKVPVDGVESISLNISSLLPGVYILQAKSGDEKVVIKFTKL